MGPELKQTQKLSMELRLTLQMQQTLKLLQISKVELIQLIQQELEQNPILEEKEVIASSLLDDERTYRNDEPTEGDTLISNYERDYSSAPYEDETMEQMRSEQEYEDYLNARIEGPSFVGTPERIKEDRDKRLSSLNIEKNLSEHLLEQLAVLELSEKDKEIAYHIIMNLDENGYLKGETEEENLVNLIAIKARASDDDVLRVLKIVQGFDPPGVAARNLKECLILQAKHLNIDNELLIKAIEEHLPNFEKKRYKIIAKALNISEDMVRDLERTISNLNPKPGSSISGVTAEYIKPDIEIYKENGEFKIRIVKDDIPKIDINQKYLSIMRKRGRDPNSRFVRDKYRLAKIFLSALNDRENKLKQVAEIILKRQRDFFEKGEGHLKPLQEKDIANELNLNVSTVSRIFSSKYILTPFGVYPLKYFIKRPVISNESENMTNDVIMNIVRKMIEEEDPKYPLKDDEIARRLHKSHNITLKRRTIAKYREKMGIPPYNIRKNMKGLLK
ncbi:MAG: RNA polymerase factor sigma-54 [Deltaproteobacteria bacterium]|nr:RNA polymerase factor sigma-54 [Deltaproteobacteria bacterium]